MPPAAKMTAADRIWRPASPRGRDDPKFPAANKLRCCCCCRRWRVASAASPAGRDAAAQPKRKARQAANMTTRPSPLTVRRGPNRSYQQGPHTRVYRHQALLARCRRRGIARRPQVQRLRVPAGVGYPSFARENNNRPIDRQPLNPPSDLGGYPQRHSRSVLKAFQRLEAHYAALVPGFAHGTIRH